MNDIQFNIKKKHNILVELEEVDGDVVINFNGLQVAFFHDGCLHLLPECDYGGKIPKEILDERGYLKIRK